VKSTTLPTPDNRNHGSGPALPALVSWARGRYRSSVRTLNGLLHQKSRTPSITSNEPGISYRLLVKEHGVWRDWSTFTVFKDALDAMQAENKCNPLMETEWRILVVRQDPEASEG